MAGGKQKNARQKAKHLAAKQKAVAREEREKEKEKIQQRKKDIKQKDHLMKEQKQQKFLQQQQYMLYSENTFVPSPVFTGSDSTCDSQLKRMERKRDAITISRALQELNEYAFSTTTAKEHPLKKPEKVATLANLLHLYKAKLSHDNHYSVRSRALYILTEASKSVPKAWVKFITGILSHPQGEENNGVGNVIGWIYISTCDPMTEVKRAANALWDTLHTDITNGNYILDDEDNHITPLEQLTMLYQAVWDHLLEVLQVTIRPHKLNQALFDTKKGDKEEMEERFERVVLTTLRAMNHFMSSSIYTENFTLNDNIPLLYRNMISHRANFRIATYMLTSTICNTLFTKSTPQTHEQNKEHFKTLTPLLLRSLSFEKDPANFPKLIELFLFYISSLRNIHGQMWNYTDKEENQDEGQNDNEESQSSKHEDYVDVTINISVFMQGLTNSLSVAFYGCPANQWAPSILPLCATLPKHDKELQLKLLTCLWKSRHSTSNSMDKTSIAASAAECATFLLLRRQSDEHQSQEEFSKNIAQFFLDSLSHYLGENAQNISNVWTQQLVNTLTHDLVKLDAAVYSKKTNCDIHCIQTWFWDHISSLLLLNHVPNPDAVTIGRVTFFIQKIMSISNVNNEVQNSEEKAGHQNDVVSHLHPIFGDLFHSLLSKLGTTLPEDEKSSLFLSIFKFCGLKNIFVSDSPSDDAAIKVENFCMNDLLRWIILRTSTASPANSFSSAAIETDFHMLFECIQSFSDLAYRKKIWECILDELIKARCELSRLSLGIAVLSKDLEKAGGENFLCCSDRFDRFAVDVGKWITSIAENEDQSTEVSQHLDAILHDCSNSNLLLFLQICVGRSPISSNIMLLRPSVIQSWVQSICYNELDNDDKYGNIDIETDSDEDDGGKGNQLLVVLLDLASQQNIEDSVLSEDDIIQLALLAFRKGGVIWYKSALDMLLGEHGTSTTVSNKAIGDVSRLIDVASSQIIHELNETHFPASLKNGELDSRAYAWSQQAGRLLQIYTAIDGTKNYKANCKSIVGLQDLAIWQKCLNNIETRFGEKLYLSLIYLLQNMKDEKLIRDFIGITHDDPNELLLLILLSIVQPKLELTAEYTRQISHCIVLFQMLGGITNFTGKFIENLCVQLTDTLENYMKINFDDKEGKIILDKGIILLDWLLGIYFEELNQNSENNESVNPSNVKEGDIFWYITNPNKDDDKRVQAEIVKIHTDDYPNLYFTIKVQNEKDTNQNLERQTVASRLRKVSGSVQTKTQVSKKLFQQKIESKIVDKLIKPNISTILNEGQISSKMHIVAELLNVVISRCGLKGKGGIGSVRHDVFKVLSSFENSIERKILSLEIDDEVGQTIRYLSIALGFGNLSAACDSCFRLMFTPSRVLSALSNLFFDCERDTDTLNGSFLESALMLLQVSAASLSEDESINLMKLGNSISKDLLNGVTSTKTTNPNLLSLSYVSTNVLDLTQKSIHRFSKSNLNASFHAIEQEYLSSVLYYFTDLWTDMQSIPCSLGTRIEILDDTLDDNDPYPAWYSSFKPLILENIKTPTDRFIGAIFSKSNEICQTLHSKSKSWLAYQLITIFIRNSEKYCEEKAIQSSEPTQNLRKWTNGMDFEEAEELKEDISETMRWLPEHMMNALESWEVEPACDSLTDSEKSMGRMLEWLLCLDFLDHAAAIDMRNRSHISSYIQRTGSLNAVLSIALTHAKLDNKKDSSSWMTCLSIQNEKNFILSNVCTLVVFRSVEVLPTLVKTWWTDDCPRSMQNIVSQFVQNMIAPEALRRELIRINNATTLGEMNVNGSCVSREVIATYVQDECELSVMIKIPQSFPLRNVEVDCKKTLGIGEKRWRHWALQIMRMLNKDDGSVLDALLLWKQNVEKEFDGVEPCPVCYSVLCVKTHSMPNLECKTCKNRFHSSCLYKWFHSSGKSQCVLCQEPWSGTKIS